MWRYTTRTMTERSRSDLALWLRRRAWDAKRFGLFPSGAKTKLGFGRGPRIVSTSIPKAGSHLVERALCLHPDLSRMISRKIMYDKATQLDHLERLLKRQRPGQIICGHIRFYAEAAALLADHDAVVVFVIRDPRDIVVSNAHYVWNYRKHPLHETALEYPVLRDRIRMFVDGREDAGVPAIADVLGRYSGWLDESQAIVRYEQMVNPESGPAATAKLFNDLGMTVSPELVRSISGRLVSPVSVTFRKGESGGWREEMEEGLGTRLHESAGEYLDLYGYR